MSKATPTDVQGLGFHESQFGEQTDFTAYLQDILDDIALQVEDLVGASVYAAAVDGIGFMRMKNAEMYLAAAELWRRIENHERSDVSKGRGDGGSETVSSRALRNAKEATEQADVYLMQMGVSLASSSAGGIAVGVNESGPYTAVTS